MAKWGDWSEPFALLPLALYLTALEIPRYQSTDEPVGTASSLLTNGRGQSTSETVGITSNWNRPRPPSRSDCCASRRVVERSDASDGHS